MTDKGSKSEGQLYWERVDASSPKLPKTTEAIGKRCARDGCDSTKNISYEKPLCWAHWKEFDSFEIDECSRCHWFDDSIYDAVVYDCKGLGLCRECEGREKQKASPVPVYAHGPVERRDRYLYVLKMDGGKWYVGQTNSMEIRLQEHQDGLTSSTRGKHPKLVWFEKWHADYDALIEEEEYLTRLAVENPRAIRRMVEEWRKPHRLVDLDA